MFGYGIVVYNQKGFIVYINNKATKMFGYKKNELLHCSFLKLIPFRMIPENIEMFEKAAHQKMTPKGFTERQRLTKNGTIINVSVKTLCFNYINTFMCVIK